MKIKTTEDSKKSHPLYAILKNNPDLVAPFKEDDTVTLDF